MTTPITDIKPVNTEIMSVKCTECNQLVFDNVSFYGKAKIPYCNECFDRIFIQCMECQDWYDKDDTKIKYNDTGDVHCEDCYNDIYSHCDNCSNEYNIQNEGGYSDVRDESLCQDCYDELVHTCANCSKEVNDSYCDNGDYYCEECYYEDHIICENCSDRVHIDDSMYSDSDDLYYCQDCYSPSGHNHHIEKIYSETFNNTDNIKRWYGIELECIGSDNGLELDNFQTGEDCSVVGGSYGLEYRSDILQGDRGFSILDSQCNKLLENYQVNKSCGFHVHIDANDLDYKNICNIMSFISVFDDIIFSLMPNSRKNDNTYCGKYTLDSKVLHDTYQSKKLDLLHRIGRYKGFNINAYFIHGTLEFRYHSGTLNNIKIKNWIKTCLKIVEVAKDNKCRIKNRLTPSISSVYAFCKYLKLDNELTQYWIERFNKFNNE